MAGKRDDRAQMRCSVLVVAVLVAGPAFGEPSGDLLQFEDTADDARALFEQGKRAYAIGSYLEAAHAFEEAYRVSDRYALLWNIGKAYRRQFDVDHDAAGLRKAKTVFENFAQLTSSMVERVEGRSAANECERLLGRGEASPPVIAPPPAAHPIVLAPAAQPAMVPTIVAQPPPRSHTKWLWPVLGVGAALVVGAVIAIVLVTTATDYAAQTRAQCVAPCITLDGTR